MAYYLSKMSTALTTVFEDPVEDGGRGRKRLKLIDVKRELRKRKVETIATTGICQSIEHRVMVQYLQSGT